MDDHEFATTLLLLKKRIMEKGFWEEEREMLLSTVDIILAFMFPEWMYEKNE